VTQFYMLDTDISSYILKNRDPNLRVRLNRLAMDQVSVSVVTKAELLYGVQRSTSAKINRKIVDAFLTHLTVLSWNGEAAEHYAQIRAALDRKGTPIGNLDTMIAAHARSLGAIIVTNNVRHFKKVPGLKVENWV
jgi:tRNA(fMet)-specific endonuclease VapC